MKYVSIILGVFLFIQPTFASAGKKGSRTIYGDDNRLDIYQETDTNLVKLADSTVALFESSSLTKTETGYALAPVSFGQQYGLCPSQPFVDEPVGAFCSGALVAPDLVISAGHCIWNQSDCDNVKFVFGFAVKSTSIYPNEFPDADVYGCKEIVSRTMTSNADYSVLRLERAVTNHTPLPINRGTALNVGDDIGVIGYPAGMPVKISYGATVRTADPTLAYYVTNLDTFGGNSGSPVFNAKTGNIEGILVRGDADFLYNSSLGCYESHVCPADGCRGEDVTRISEVLNFVPQQ